MTARDDGTRARGEGPEVRAVEREADARAREADARLLRLAARAELRRADSPRWSDAALRDWVAREVESGRRAAPSLGARGVREAAERMRARAWACRLGVAEGDALPVTRRAPVASPCAAALELASAHRCAPRLDLAIAAGGGRALWDEACDEWVALPADLPSGRYLALRVAGESMLPLLLPRDVVLVRVGVGTPLPDTVVVARRPDDGYVVKRVGRVTRRSVELLSLNPAFAPVRVPNAPGVVLGTVVWRWRG